MQLRFRITLVVSIALAAITTAMFVVAHLREAGAEARYRERQLYSYQVIWQQFLDKAAGDIEAKAAPYLLARDLITAIQRRDRAQVGMLVAPLLPDLSEHLGRPAAGGLRLDILGPEGETLYSSAAAVEPTALISGALMRRVLSDRGRLRGVRADRQGLLLATAAFPLTVDGMMAGAAIVGLDLALPLRNLAEVLEADIYAVDHSGRLLAGFADARWLSIAQAIDLTQQQITEVRQGDRYYEVSNIVVADLVGGRIGSVTIADDVTAPSLNHELWTQAYVSGTAVIVLIVLILLHIFMHHSFEPLHDGLLALRDLANGHMRRHLDLRRGSDEVGQISDTVEVFRSRLRAFDHLNGQSVRRRRRQVRLIARQLEALANGLEGEIRVAVLEDLRFVQTSGREIVAEGGSADDLALVVEVFGRLARRLAAQQEQVSLLSKALMPLRNLPGPEPAAARVIQEACLPRRLAVPAGWDMAARLIPADPVAGNFYDLFTLASGRVGIVAGDVSGKGIAAALLAQLVRVLLRDIVQSGSGAAGAVTRLSERLAAEWGAGWTVALFYGELDPASGTLLYVVAGLNDPLLRCPGELVRPLASAGTIPLDGRSGLTIEEHRVDLQAGDMVIVYSDGLPDAVNAGAVTFGNDRLLDTISVATAETAPDMADHLLEAVATHAGKAPVFDDRLCLILRRMN